jgi:hypothetical protein
VLESSLALLRYQHFIFFTLKNKASAITAATQHAAHLPVQLPREVSNLKNRKLPPQLLTYATIHILTTATSTTIVANIMFTATRRPLPHPTTNIIEMITAVRTIGSQFWGREPIGNLQQFCEKKLINLGLEHVKKNYALSATNKRRSNFQADLNICWCPFPDIVVLSKAEVTKNLKLSFIQISNSK